MRRPDVEVRVFRAARPMSAAAGYGLAAIVAAALWAMLLVSIF